MKKFIIFILILALIVCPMTVSASEDSAKENLYYMIKDLVDLGWYVNYDYDYQLLSKGETYTYRMSLYGGVQYMFAVAGCSDYAKDVDVEIYDENWNLIVKDTTTNLYSLCKVTPRWTGVYYVKVKLYDVIYGDSAHICLTYGYYPN